MATHPDLAAEQAYIDRAYDSLERARKGEGATGSPGRSALADRTRRRAPRSYALVVLVTAALVTGLYLWLTSEAPESFRSDGAGQMVPTPRPSGDTPNEGHDEPTPP